MNSPLEQLGNIPVTVSVFGISFPPYQEGGNQRNQVA